MNLPKWNRQLLSGLMILIPVTGFHVINSGSALYAESNGTDLTGQITAVDDGGRKVSQIATADGRVYIITGKLEKMIRDQYAGKTIKLSGKIEREPAGGKPGLFRVESIAVQLN